MSQRGAEGLRERERSLRVQSKHSDKHCRKSKWHSDLNMAVHHNGRTPKKKKKKCAPPQFTNVIKGYNKILYFFFF